MEIKVDIKYDQLITIIKNELPEEVRLKLKKQLNSEPNLKAKNLWQEYFEFLTDSEKRMLKEKIMKSLDFNKPSFYRKLKSNKSLSLSDKFTIARLANLPPHFLFPEVEYET